MLILQQTSLLICDFGCDSKLKNCGIISKLITNMVCMSEPVARLPIDLIAGIRIVICDEL